MQHNILIILLLLIHQEGLCIENLSIRDCCVYTDGTMKLKSNVRFVTGSLEGVDKDFSNGADVIQELLTSFSQENSLPLDQEWLL
jgi:hypothetical protein